jgi:hypothetical protein
MENFDLRKFLAEGRLLEVETPQADPIADKDAQQGLNSALALLQQGANSIKPSTQDGELDESVTLGLIAGAPGLIGLLGKGVNGISSLFQKDKKTGTVVGNALKKFGHNLEHKYIDVIGALIKKAFPKRYGNQNPNDETSELYKVAHGVYAAMLVAAAVSSGAEALEAHNLIAKGLEGGLSAFKSAEVVGLAQKIAAV